MKHWRRRLRAALGMGLTWAVAWSFAALLIARLPGVDSDLPLVFLFAPLGFVSGIVFSAILVKAERNRSLDRLSLSRFAGWGAASGLLLSGMFVIDAALRGASASGEFLLFGPALTVASAVCASGTLALAKRASRRELRDPR